MLWWTTQPSRILRRITITGQFLTCVLMLVLSPDAGSKVLLILAICHYCERRSEIDRKVYTIRYHRQSGWTLQAGLSPRISILLVGVYRPAHRWLLVRYHQQDSRQILTLALAPDSLAVSAYSRLYRQLRWTKVRPVLQANLSA